MNYKIELKKCLMYIYRMDFQEYLTNQKLKPHTIKNHMRNINRFDSIGDTQPKMIEQIDTQPTLSLKQSVAGTFSKYLQYNNQPNDLILKYIKDTYKVVQIKSAERHKAIAEDKSLPNTQQLIERMNELYELQNWKGFCILYLLINYQIRNMDMVAGVVRFKKSINETDNWFIVGKDKVVWIRNKYKTSTTYGQKIIVITDEKFRNAISKLDALLTPKDNIDRVVKKITGGYTESLIAKITLRDNNSINGLNKMSKNRGTDVNTLASQYNITLPDME